MRSIGGIAGVALALLAAGGGLGVAVWPVAGRTVESWAPTVARFVTALAADGRMVPWRPPRGFPRRGTVAHLRLGQQNTTDFADLGVIEDEEAATWSVVLPAGGQGYALLDETGRASAVAAWSGVLTAMAAEVRGLHRLQWIARTYRSSIEQADEPDATIESSPAAGAYRSLLSELGPRLWEREVLLVITTGSPRSSLSSRARAASEDETIERLALYLRTLTERLRSAGLAAGRPLARDQLAATVRRSHELEPGAGASGWPWPIGVESRWAVLRTDATWHAVYWVSEWPRGDVGPGVLLPLLIGGGHRRTVSVTMAPLPPVSAVRRAERERTSGAADAELRRRHGFALTARARAEQDVRLQREAELAEGHAAYLFSGYVCVTAGDESSLEDGCTEVEQSAALAQLELRRVYGAQEEAWCCTLPIGRGCR